MWAQAGAPAAAAAPVLPSDDPFYSYSGALASVAPGTPLKTRPVQIVDAGLALPFSATQVLYRTTGELGQPTATVATIIRPLTGSLTAVKLVSYQTAYDALGPVCDPSYTLQGGNPGYTTAVAEEQLIALYVTAGDTVVVPDYEGEHLDWGAGQESGYGTLDGIRAAERSLGLSAASTPVAMVGYSGGSIATDFAAELAPTYAHELDIVGVAEGGVPVDFAHNLNYINGSRGWSGVIPAVLIGVGRAFGIEVSRYESAYGRKVAAQVSNECINSFYGNYPGLTIQQLVKPAFANFLSVPLFARTVNHLIMGDTGTPAAPMFIGVGNADGTGDGVMVAADVEALAHAYCRRGVSVQFDEYRGDDHGGAAIPFEVAALTFLTERLNGAQVADGCGAIGAGDSLAPLPVPSVRIRLGGLRHREHGVVVNLRSTVSPLGAIVLELRHAGRLVKTLRLGTVPTRRWRPIVLRVRHRASRYMIVISQAGTVLARRSFRLR